MSAPVCPTQLELTHLIKLFDTNIDEPAGDDDAGKIQNALRYLENFLSARRGYQRKMQIKRRVLTQYAKEQGWDKEIDDAVKMQFGDDIDKMTLGEDDE